MKQYRIGFNDGTTMLVFAARYSHYEKIISFLNTGGNIIATVSLYNMKYIEIV